MGIPITCLMVVATVLIAKRVVDHAIETGQVAPSLSGCREQDGLLVWHTMSHPTVDEWFEGLASLGLKIPWSDDPDVAVVETVQGLGQQEPAWLVVSGDPWVELTMELNPTWRVPKVAGP